MGLTNLSIPRVEKISKPIEDSIVLGENRMDSVESLFLITIVLAYPIVSGDSTAMPE